MIVKGEEYMGEASVLHWEMEARSCARWVGTRLPLGTWGTHMGREDGVGEGRPPAGCMSCRAVPHPVLPMSCSNLTVQHCTHNCTPSFEWSAESSIFKTMPDPAPATLLKSAEAPPFARRILTYLSRRLRQEGDRMLSITEHQAPSGRKTFCGPCGCETTETLSTDKLHVATWSLPTLHIT